MRGRSSASPAEEAGAFNRALIANHLVGAGPDASAEIVRATMLRLANALASGTPGVRPEIAERLTAALNGREHPRVRLLGSLGQADLPAMADLAHGLFGEVELEAQGSARAPQLERVLDWHGGARVG